jgi:peptidoglycan hydrolase FlgJ
MIDRIQASGRPNAGAPAPPRSAREQRDATLMKTASQLEGMFVQQLYKAMRETVPQQEGIVSGGAGEDIFTGLLDQHLAAETPKQWDRGIAQALYRQLRHGAPADAPQPSVPTPDFNTR